MPEQRCYLTALAGGHALARHAVAPPASAGLKQVNTAARVWADAGNHASDAASHHMNALTWRAGGAAALCLYANSIYPLNVVVHAGLQRGFVA